MKKTKETPNSGPEMMNWDEFSSTGFEAVSHDDLGIPFLSIIQSKSPEVDESNPEYATYGIEGAKVGAIFQSLSREILWKPKDEYPLVFVPCFFQKLFVEWNPRDAGGGIIRSHSDPSVLAETKRNEKNQDVLRNGHIIVTTSYFFGEYLQEEEWKKGIISMTSTQLKKARLWLNMASSLKIETPRGKITPPLFSHRYLITTIPESNAKGSWIGWKVEQGGIIQTPETVKQLAEFSKTIRETQSRLLLTQGAGSEEAEAIPV